MSEPPALHVQEPDGDVRAVALVLHGGRSRSTAPTRANQLAVLRMRPFATRLHAVGATHGLAVARVRFRVRGWNGSDASPVADTGWALDELNRRFPGVPAALVGHSMGGRAAVYAAGHEAVAAVVGLAPWIEPGDPYAQLSGRRVLFVHGTGDRMTSPVESERLALEARTLAASVGYVSVQGETHPMLRRPGLWHDLAAGFVLAAVCDLPPERTVSRDAANVLVKALAGQTSLSV